MTVELRVPAPDEIDDLLHAEEPAWGEAHGPEERQAARGFLEPERTLMAVEGGNIVGAAAMVSLRLAVPGGRIPMAGLTFVFVLPTHRRQGLLSRMLRTHLEELRDGQEPLCGLFASESSIYRRFGFGASMLLADTEIARAHAALVDDPPVGGRLELVDQQSALILAPPVFERAATLTNGMFDRTLGAWEYVYWNAREAKDGAGPTQFLIHHGPRGVDGFATYRLKPHWERSVADYGLDVQEVVALSPVAELDIWRHLLSHDLVGLVRADNRPVDDPLTLLLADPRRMQRRLVDGLHLRAVHVAAALSARRYAREDAVTLRVVDTFCPWTEGVFRLEGGLENAVCEPSDAAADLVVDAAALGSVLLGEFSLEMLHRAGRVDEITLGAVRRASAMFAWSPRPWASGHF